MKKIIFIPILLLTFACKDKETVKPNTPEQSLHERIQGDWKIVKSTIGDKIFTYPQAKCNSETVACMLYYSIAQDEAKKILEFTDNELVYSSEYMLSGDTISAIRERGQHSYMVFNGNQHISFSGDTLIFSSKGLELLDNGLLETRQSKSYYIKK